MAQTILHGIDVSSYQGSVNWDQIQLDHEVFAATKATEGNYYHDERFPTDWYGMQMHGLRRFAYHFLIDDIPAQEQVDYHHAYVRDNGHYLYGDAGLLDVEEASISHAVNTQAVIEAFILAFWHDINKPLMLYTNYNTWVNIMGNPVSSIIAECPLWLADWGPYVPQIGQWPNGLSFWQYSDVGRLNGIAGYVDLDRFYGSMRQLSRIMTVVPHA